MTAQHETMRDYLKCSSISMVLGNDPQYPGPVKIVDFVAIKSFEINFEFRNWHSSEKSIVLTQTFKMAAKYDPKDDYFSIGPAHKNFHLF